MKKFNIKKVDFLTILLSFLLLAIPVFLYITNTINKNIQQFSKQSTYLTHLKLINKDFNYFILQKGVISNYDDINHKVVDFYKTLHLLKYNLQKNVYENNTRYIKELDSIEKDFKTMVKLLEHTKSYNSLIVNSLSYLSDLKKSLHKILNKDDALLDDTLFLSMQLYANDITNKKLLENYVEKIHKLAQKKHIKYLDYFYAHEKSIISRIYALKKEQKIVKEKNIYKRLDKIYRSLKKDFTLYLKVGNNLIIGILVFSGFLLITTLYLHRKSLKNKKELTAYKYAIENSDNSIVITDTNYNITYVNSAFEKITGYKKEEVLGQNPRILKSNLLENYHYEELYQALENKQKWMGDFVNKRKDGSIFYEKASISPIIIDDTITGYISIKLDITEYIQQKEKIQFLAYHDTLTTLPNRLKFEEYFKTNIENKEKSVALIYIDIDNFKTINDTLGHHFGDKLLKKFSKKLQKITPKGEFIAKIGGDEFVIIADIYNEKKIVYEILEKINKMLSKNFTIKKHQISITTSIGIALYPENGKNLNQLLKNVDIALHYAKVNGKNNYQFFTQKLSDKINERHTLEQELSNALKNQELYMVYQPKYDLISRKTIGFEALIRWENKKLGFVPPDKFIQLAEEIGLIDDIGYFVYEQACKDFSRFKKIDDSLNHIAINISTKQFESNTFIPRILELTKENQLTTKDIELEVTETYIMNDIEKNIKHLQNLRDLGFKIAIDDFGTGYSSFSYLKNLPITTLKIDKSFVDDICSNDKDKNISNTIIILSKNLGFKTVAEGIEYKEQEELLKQMKCDIGQGYFYSRPLKADDVLNFISSNTIKQLLKEETTA